MRTNGFPGFVFVSSRFGGGEDFFFPSGSIVVLALHFVYLLHLFAQFCFQFNRQGTHRTLDKEMVVALMKMVLKERVPDDRLDTFITFLDEQKSYTRITLDQWTSFLDFCYECEDLSTYDESTSAWPVLIDEYVDYMEQQQQKK